MVKERKRGGNKEKKREEGKENTIDFHCLDDNTLLVTVTTKTMKIKSYRFQGESSLVSQFVFKYNYLLTFLYINYCIKIYLTVLHKEFPMSKNTVSLLISSNIPVDKLYSQ